MRTENYPAKICIRQSTRKDTALTIKCRIQFPYRSIVMVAALRQIKQNVGIKNYYNYCISPTISLTTIPAIINPNIAVMCATVPLI